MTDQATKTFTTNLILTTAHVQGLLYESEVVSAGNAGSYTRVTVHESPNLLNAFLLEVCCAMLSKIEDEGKDPDVNLHDAHRMLTESFRPGLSSEHNEAMVFCI